mgnify:CR=1 FL=1
MPRRLRPLRLLAAAFLALSTGAAPRKELPALPLEDHPAWQAVGRLNTKGYNRRGMCSGALVAPDLVLTAAHCLAGPDGNPVRCVPITGAVRPLRMGFLTAQDADRSNAVRAFIEYGSDLVRAGKLARIGGEPIVPA